MPSIPGAQIGVNYLDMQAYVGITKHNGGREATDELLTLCHVENAREVLNGGLRDRDQQRLHCQEARLSCRGHGYFGENVRLHLTQPAAGQSLKMQFGSSAGSLKTMGYGIFVGRKPDHWLY